MIMLEIVNCCKINPCFFTGLDVLRLGVLCPCAVGVVDGVGKDGGEEGGVRGAT